MAKLRCKVLDLTQPIPGYAMFFWVKAQVTLSFGKECFQRTAGSIETLKDNARKFVTSQKRYHERLSARRGSLDGSKEEGFDFGR